MPERIAVLYLQPQCNMSCAFCITRDGFQRMTPREGRTLLSGLQGLGVSNAILGGGEPLAWPHDLKSLAGFAQSLGMRVQVGTNGIRLTEALMQAPEIDRFILPLESADASVHDSLRVCKGGHHALILDRIGALIAHEKEFTLSTVISRANLERLEPLAERISAMLVRGARLHAWHLYRFLPQGRGGSLCADELGITLEAYRSACAGLKARFPQLPILLRPDMTRSKSVGFFWMERGEVRSLSPYGGLLHNANVTQ